MTNGQVGSVIVMLCCFGSAGLFDGIGIWAKKRKTPMWFWAETKPIDPGIISDIPAYNRENSAMWLRYSLWFWVSGVCGVLGLWEERFLLVSVAILLLSATAGIWLLIRSYGRILKKYAACTKEC